MLSLTKVHMQISQVCRVNTNGPRANKLTYFIPVCLIVEGSNAGILRMLSEDRSQRSLDVREFSLYKTIGNEMIRIPHTKLRTNLTEL